MNSKFLTLFALFAVTLCCPSRLWGVPISKRIESQVRSKVLPAYRQDDWRAYGKILSNWVDKYDNEELDQIDAVLEANGAPSIGRLMLDARMAELLDGDTKNNRTPARELTRSMPVLRNRIESMVDEVKESRFFQDVLPEMDVMQDYHDAFWEMHVAKNKLANARKLARYGQRITERAKEGKLRELTEDERAVLETDFAAQARNVEKALKEVRELKTELQILGLGKAAKIIRESDDYKERLRAGYVIEFSADPVLETLRETKLEDFDRPLLKDDRLLTSVEASIRYARESSSDLLTQTRLLFLGMHWWMRGRYGQGPDGMGLLKSVHALRSNEAQFPLYMPVHPPKPTEMSSSSGYGNAVPKFDRRHHYIWMYEYRTISVNARNRTELARSTTRKITSKTKLNRFY